MESLPKPKHCGENWLAMRRTDGGRICGACNKKIVDFSRMSWKEIEAFQQQNNNAVCGMYLPEQLDHWGKEIPKRQDQLVKTIAVTGLSLFLAGTATAQTINVSDSIVISGKVIDEKDGYTMPGIYVVMKKNHIFGVTDFDGNFKLIVKSNLIASDTLEFICAGYQKKQLAIEDIKKIDNLPNDSTLNDVQLNIMLTPATESFSAFYVEKPTYRQRTKWFMRKWFGRKKTKGQ